MNEISERQLKIGVVIAIALQLLVVALFFFDIIHDPNHQTGRFIFHHGGDENDYFDLARSLLTGTLIDSKFSLGYPLMLSPWIAAFRATVPADVIQPVALFSALVMFPLAQMLFASLVVRVAHNRNVALIAVLIWTLLPLILYAVMGLIHRAELGAIWAVHLPWMQMLSDPPTAFFTILSFWLLFYVLDTTDHRKGLIGTIFLGLVCGFLLLIRLNAILSVAAVGLVLAWSRRWRTLALVAGLAFVVFIPQLLYNAAHFGNPLLTGYQVLDTQPPNGLMSIQYPLKVVTGRYGLPIVALGLAAALFIGFALVILWRRDRMGALAVGIWAVGYLIFFSLYYYSWVGSFTRFLLPAYPALALIAALVIAWVADQLLTRCAA